MLEEDDELFESAEENVADEGIAEEIAIGAVRNGKQRRLQEPRAASPRSNSGLLLPLSRYELWSNSPLSIQERRKQLLRVLGLEEDRGSSSTSRSAQPAASASQNVRARAESRSLEAAGSDGFVDRIGAVLCNSPLDDHYPGSEILNCGRRIKDLDTGKEYELDGADNKVREVETGREISLEEFESSLGHSPLTKEVHRRARDGREVKQKKKKGWLQRIKHASSSSTNSSSSGHNKAADLKAQRVKVRSHKKAYKELTELHLRQEIQAHQGPIWALKFSPDGRYLASGGQDCAVRVWELRSDSLSVEAGIDATLLPSMLSFVEKALCTFRGHTEDILDLSWSRSQFLLSSSMDKTVRLWHLSQHECLQVFAHNDYVTCIQFNPADDKYFLSGSLDQKVRIWSIPDCQVVGWTDIREIVTALCFTPDGKGAMVGSYKGTCRFYNTAGNKLQLVDVLNLKGRRSHKKITGLQCMPGNPRRLLVTSSDSSVRIFEGAELACKYTGFRNANGHFAASFSAHGDFIISASEDSLVYIWSSINPDVVDRKGIQKSTIQSYEEFYSHTVTVALPWPGLQSTLADPNNKQQNGLQSSTSPVLLENSGGEYVTESEIERQSSATITTTKDDCSASEEYKLASNTEMLPPPVRAWGLAIATSSYHGQIRIFQNYGLPHIV